MNSSLTSSFPQKLSQLCEQLSFPVTATQQQQLLLFLEQLIKWNKIYNLTAIKDPNKMLSHHIMDSLAISPYITAPKIADVGTGAGIPGIPLAILHPHKTFYLIDSNGKKVRFIKQTIHHLGLKNVIALHKRVESVEIKVDVVISRAFASINDMIEGTTQLLEDKGLFLAMKGKQPKQELEQLTQTTKNIKLLENHRIQVPGLDAERCLLCLQKQKQ